MVNADMPVDKTQEISALEGENERLKASLRRCRSLVAECRWKLAANANGNYRPPYASDSGQKSSQSNN
jgi:hypothetical protein